MHIYIYIHTCRYNEGDKILPDGQSIRYIYVYVYMHIYIYIHTCRYNEGDKILPDGQSIRRSWYILQGQISIKQSVGASGTLQGHHIGTATGGGHSNSGNSSANTGKAAVGTDGQIAGGAQGGCVNVPYRVLTYKEKENFGESKQSCMRNTSMEYCVW